MITLQKLTHSLEMSSGAFIVSAEGVEEGEEEYCGDETFVDDTDGDCLLYSIECFFEECEAV